MLVANGPSLNKIRWDWQDNFNVIMGMNKIFLGLERYNITKVRGPPAYPLPSSVFSFCPGVFAVFSEFLAPKRGSGAGKMAENE